MRKLLWFIGLWSGLLSAQKIPDAQKGVEYGAGVSEAITFNVHTPDQLIKALENKDEIEQIIIQGKASEVCAKKGCWITLENSKNIPVFVKMKDYAFFLPQNIVGKTLLLDAKATKKLTSVKELQHYAEDAGKSRAEIDNILNPKMEIRVLATGIKVID